MKQKLIALILVLVVSLACGMTVSAEEMLVSDTYTLHVDIIKPEGTVMPSPMRFNICNENGEWLANRHVDIQAAGSLSIEFSVPKYKIGKRFKLVATTGIAYLNSCDKTYKLGEEFLVETYAYRDENGALIIVDDGHIVVCPLTYENGEAQLAEERIRTNQILSETDYLIWVSKSDFTVSVFLRNNGAWENIKQFPCSIGKPSTPTVTGQFRYYQYHDKWQYSGYYVGPVMRFYNGYAIHTTLLKDDGTDYDGRVGARISLGCVRVRPENMNWLVYYIPFGTKIYITE